MQTNATQHHCWIVTYTYADGHTFRSPSAFATHGDACRHGNELRRDYGHTYAVQRVCATCEGTERVQRGHITVACPDCRRLR